MKFKTILAIIFAALIVVFSLQNSEVTDVNFFIWKISMSRVLVILGSFGLGVIVGILVSMKKRYTNVKKY
ncbi:MAG: LapA family protein [Maribacter sp.]